MLQPYKPAKRGRIVAMKRKIIHIDMDCFFAQVEMRENPALKNKPVAVGGDPKGRSVVAACSYEARKFGVHSAMPMKQAIQKCPNLQRVPVRMALYKQVSRHIFLIFKQYTDKIEPLSLDEAFLDVSDCRLHQGSASLIAQEIRQKIWRTQKLTASAGIAPNKFLAKIASDWRKPNGQFVITPQEIPAFIRALPVQKIYGVGKVTAQKMAALGLHHCADLQQCSMAELQQNFGKFGARLYTLSRGEDAREVQSKQVRKSLSIEHTFATDLSLASCLTKIPAMVAALAQQKAMTRKIKTVVIKLKTNDFKTTTAQVSAASYNVSLYQSLCKKAWARHPKPVRLLGIGVRFDTTDSEQLRLL